MQGRGSINENEWYERGCGAWPALHVERDPFLFYCRERIEGPIRAERLADLFLACACTLNAPGAIETFRREYVPYAVRALQRARIHSATHDDTIQELLVKLFLGSETIRPKIIDYRGSGPLSAWVSVAAVRVALNRLSPTAIPSAQFPVVLSTKDPEFAFIQERYRPDFERAVRDTLSVMSDDDVRLLRRHFIAGEALTTIAKDSGVTHTTVSRWLARVKETLMSEVRRLLVARLGLTLSEIESVARALQSQLDEDCATVLRAADAHPT